MNTFFIADTHFGHDNIRRHCNRPWPTIDEHDQALIDNWNKVVTRKDLVYILGDFAMIKKMSYDSPMKKYRRIIQTLNGKKVLIKGNHDAMNQETYACFSEVYDGIRLTKINKEQITLSHFPLRSWHASHHGAFAAFGHVHGRLENINTGVSCDIGVDVPEWNYSPVSWDILRSKLLKKREIWLNNGFKI